MEISFVATGSWDNERICVVVWGDAGLGGEARLIGSAEHPGDVTGLVSGPACCQLLLWVPGAWHGVVQDWPQLHRAEGERERLHSTGLSWR